MPDLLAELLPAPTLYPQKFDPVRDTVYFVGLDEAAYRAASFLDDRLLAPGMQGRWLPYPAVEQALRGAGAGKPLHFIFHSGHVGSTLLSRLIDEAGGVLGLREPLPLRTLAEMQDRLGAGGSEPLEARLATFVNLWRRGFAQTEAVVLKATSSAGRLAPRLLAANPSSKAVYLSLPPEPYLATLLAGANAATDLRGFEMERRRRLRGMLGDVVPAPASIGELSAVSWLAESLTRTRACEAFGSRVLPLDFEHLLANLAATLAQVLAHFEIGAAPGFAEAIGASAVLTRYSKAPLQYPYSPAMRAQLLAQARAEQGGEIAKGLKFLERIAAKDARVAALL